MFKFGGFKATLNLGSSSKKKEIYENGPALSVGGAYRTHREEFFGRGSLSEPPKKLTPSMVKLPPSAQGAAIKTSKSTNDLSNPYNLSPQLRKSTPDVSTDPRGGPSHNRDSSALHRNAKANSKEVKTDLRRQEKEQKELEKKRINEQKKREKAEAQEQARQDKLRIQRDRQIAQQQARDVKLRKEQEKKKKGRCRKCLKQRRSSSSGDSSSGGGCSGAVASSSKYRNIDSSPTSSSAASKSTGQTDSVLHEHSRKFDQPKQWSAAIFRNT
ncbi:hypothetical protein MSG28_001455 [Choristoneura fumiferana]|uniref:Uncharacterized protein n=1 Tax=Choristoneura fumiferana TaxID=7141 RepID=A0ACC0KTT9_CHOFU|nr:hypothetical protein MSG28_001455 [Choristoneura fumiferana]